jgi:anti-sigma-K factor RskA
VSQNGHEHHQEDVGAYLLGALEPAEQAAFEGHLASCHECRAEVDQLRMAADALPRSVEPFAPPPSLKRSLMEAVRDDARPERRSLIERLGLDRLFTGARPALAMAGAAFVLVAGIAVGTQLSGGGEGNRVVPGVVDRSRVPQATASVTLPKDGNGLAQLRVTGLPNPKPGQVYEIWLKRGDQLQPGPLFSVDAGGNGAGAIPDDLGGVSTVLVTRERTGGAKVPSEPPIISARIS